MIFFIFAILWIAFADSVWCFILPVICLFIRAAYRERKLQLFTRFALGSAFVITLFNYLASDRSTDDRVINFLFFLRLVIFSALMLHIVDCASRGSFRAWPKVNYLIYTGMRVFSIVKERLMDTWYIFKTRWGNTKFTTKIPLLAFTMTNFLLECILIYNQMTLVNYEKGGTNILNNRVYSDASKKNIRIMFKHRKVELAYSTIGDLFLLLIVFIPLVDYRLIPSRIVLYYHNFINLFS